MTERSLSPLAEWIVAECAARGLTWAEASRRAGVDKSSISLIVRGQRPGIATCRALARVFDVPVEQVLRLAGHLEGSSQERTLPPVLRILVQELEQLPDEMQEPLLDAWRAMLDATRIAAKLREEEGQGRDWV